MLLPSHPIERARPLLGTIVRIRIQGLPSDLANDAIDAAFGLLADIHRLMSFHEPSSELSHLNRKASYGPVPVSSHTQAVLSHALELSRVSGGLFDPTIALALVEDGLLPALPGVRPDPEADWNDVTISPDGVVSFAKPLWLDLGGIAKGYAVDCAFDYLAARSPTHLCVEAGGDLRLMGPVPELIYLSTSHRGSAIPAIHLENAALASSGSQTSMVCSNSTNDSRLICPHIDPRSGQSCKADRFVSVVAPCCIDADALTKVVMAAGKSATPVLERHHAMAFMMDDNAWTSICSNQPMPISVDF
ncbi:FAD:protein FMN transferase [Dyella sp. A6]|uniref:FAD:protein FMN transferase n=1 Tax=Dyella aluminiiresistens TaxID=3069105 RepID=UPI002E779DB4|nr:FAD:protein FMN transferase [Dyella sp. A6]